MPQITTNAIVVRRADYRENDRMITLFSPSLGRIDALCRGCRRQKSPLMAASELFCSGEYVLYQSGERTTVVSCAVTDTYYPLRSDYERLSHGMYCLELCAAAIQPMQENERLFLLLLRSLAHLCYGEIEPRRVTAVFLMGMTSLLGFRPQVGRCARCGTPILQGKAGEETLIAAFSPEQGGVLCPGCSAGERCRLREKDVLYLQDIMRRGLRSLDSDAACTDELFAALRSLAEGRLDIPIRSGKMLL
ncbi:MAG: DNA repair protein RecO [Clostridia bacterium]|nr:DNA repair protein RecO [Clostridia bacterium]MBQ6859783.1 DNA repair protein RecO [Clostridia bacterium]MBQ7053321.1 DNA repair protein RecO [Clostridia bacterium]